MNAFRAVSLSAASRTRRVTWLRSPSRIVCPLTSFLLLIGASAVEAQAAPPTFEAAIVARLLSADRALPSRAGASLAIGLVFRAAAPSSQNLAALEAYAALKAQPIQGLTPTTVGRAFRDLEDLESWVEREGIDLLRIADGFGPEIAEIRRLCESRRIACVSSDAGYLKQGFALGVVLRDNKPRILVNPAAARAQGLDLDPKVLELAEIVR